MRGWGNDMWFVDWRYGLHRVLVRLLALGAGGHHIRQILPIGIRDGIGGGAIREARHRTAGQRFSAIGTADGLWEECGAWEGHPFSLVTDTHRNKGTLQEKKTQSTHPLPTRRRRVDALHMRWTGKPEKSDTRKHTHTEKKKQKRRNAKEDRRMVHVHVSKPPPRKFMHPCGADPGSGGNVASTSSIPLSTTSRKGSKDLLAEIATQKHLWEFLRFSWATSGSWFHRNHPQLWPAGSAGRGGGGTGPYGGFQALLPTGGQGAPAQRFAQIDIQERAVLPEEPRVQQVSISGSRMGTAQ